MIYNPSATPLLIEGVEPENETLFSPAALERGVVLLLGNRVVLLFHRRRQRRGREASGDLGILGESDAMLRVREEIRQLSELDVTVLLRGETGTGKELVAQAIHRSSSRRQRPFLTLNAGAIPDSMAAAELFGHERGAFTSAEKRRRGFFQRADLGTLFLDEIGEASSEVQALLLRVLENGEIQPIGAEKTSRVDVRIVAATDADLEEGVGAGSFKEPLLYRLASYQIHIPPLRRRRDDFGRLFFHFLAAELERFDRLDLLDDVSKSVRPWLPASLVAQLADYRWPGNVRQLKNIVSHLVVRYRYSDEVSRDQQLQKLLVTSEPAPGHSSRAYRQPKTVTQQELLETLAAHRWDPAEAARELEISRSSIYMLIDRYPEARKAADLTRQEIEDAIRSCDGDVHAMVDALRVSEEALRRRMKRLGFDDWAPDVSVH